MVYVNSIRAETGLNDPGKVGGLMADRVLWRQRIKTRTLKPIKQASWLILVN